MRRLLKPLAPLAIAGLVLGAALAWGLRPRASLPPLPPPPTILAEPGPLPASPVACAERAPDGIQVGAGFLLQLPSGDIAGVTTAHSLAGRDLVPVHFVLNGRAEPAATFSTLYAPPGQPRTGADLTVDYVLLRPDAPPDPAIVLQPDPRGAPQPGERVTLFAPDGRELAATVESVDANGAWIRLDAPAAVEGYSGSPVLSQYTGRVVGMAVAAAPRGDQVALGLNPIRAIMVASSP